MSDRYDKNFEQQKSKRRHRRTTFYLEPGNRSQKILFPGTLKRHLTPTRTWVLGSSRSDVYNPKQAYGRGLHTVHVLYVDRSVRGVSVRSATNSRRTVQKFTTHTSFVSPSSNNTNNTNQQPTNPRCFPESFLLSSWSFHSASSPRPAW